YKIYPPHRMRAKVCSIDARVGLGAIIVQRIFLGPVGFETGVRVVNCFDREDQFERKRGFTYATLQGHPEKGRATFVVCQQKDSGRTRFVIQTQSNRVRIAGLGSLAYLIQKWSNNEALNYFRSLVLAGGVCP
ncbi:MAG: DUF1990 family protein, partial [Candidatus Omnitrophica bacterium]|nr:DUF1990 family protein [Candidatus Omnitrophota bacterium]